MATTEQGDPGTGDGYEVGMMDALGNAYHQFVEAQHSVTEGITGTRGSLWPIIVAFVAVVSQAGDGPVPTAVGVVATSLLLYRALSRG